jgi:DNA-binding Xre family transcriptional regulator
MARRLDYRWNLRQVMAGRGMFATTDLIGPLAERGIRLSSSQVYRLVAERPERLSLKILMALLDILGCSVNDLIEPVAQAGAAGTRKKKAAGGAVAWLSVDPADNDPERFWRHLVAAVDRARPGTGERAGRLLGQPTPSSFDGVVIALINAVAEWPGRDKVLLVLDDYHRVDAGQVHGPVGFLVEHLPPGLRLVLASRSDPPLPLARLRAGGQLTELRSAELRFTGRRQTVVLLQFPPASAATGAQVWRGMRA